jgi:hypothetical protein
MIIRNKFNGYGFDGARLYHDPVSLSIAATQAGAASAAAATAAAAAAAPAVVAPTLAATGTAAAQTAGLELAKQQAIQAGMQQMGTEAAKQVGLEAVKQQAGTEIAKQGIAQAAQQSGVEAAKQGIFSANPAGMPPTAGAPVTPAGPVNPAAPLNPAGGYDPAIAEQLGRQNAERLAAEGFNPAKSGQAEKLIAGDNVAPIDINSAAFDPSQSVVFKANAPVDSSTAYLQPKLAPSYPSTFTDASGKLTADTFANAQNSPGINQLIQPQAIPPNPNPFPLAPKSSLVEGAEAAFKWMGDNKLETGLGLMSAGQYMNKPEEEEDKDKYKNTVDMSEFKPSIPSQPSFTRSYEYQNYQAGGPVEDMSRMNSIGANTGFPMARLQTPAYAVSSATPMPVNALTPTADAAVDTYTGEARFAEGGISDAERREYGLSTRGQRASRNLTKSYEEMEEQRQKEAMRLFGERSDPGIVPRSRTQMMSSPYSAAMAEHARLGKKSKVPVVPLPKTNLGDIDNYMDIPIEAAQGGIMHGLGGYSDGGRLLKGPGDGVSDSIPAVIGKRQPARLADGEFVIPARIVSELGNGSTEAGARKLYAMMERVQASRKKSIGKKKVAVNSKADKHLPA